MQSHFCVNKQGLLQYKLDDLVLPIIYLAFIPMGAQRVGVIDFSGGYKPIVFLPNAEAICNGPVLFAMRASLK